MIRYVSVIFFCLTLLLSDHLHAGVGEEVRTVQQWASYLDEKDEPGKPLVLDVFINNLWEQDSSSRLHLINQLGKYSTGVGTYFGIRYTYINAFSFFLQSRSKERVTIKKLCDSALFAAYQTGDDRLIASISWSYGSLMYGMGELEPAVIYCLNAAERRQSLPGHDSTHYALLGEVLFHTRDYRNCIYYTEMALQTWTVSRSPNYYVMKYLNTIGQAYQKMGVYDSAITHFKLSLQYANKLNNELWKGINAGNIGQVYFSLKQYVNAKPLLLYNYIESNGHGEWNNAANALEWLARINLVEGKKDSAIKQLRTALVYLERWPQPAYLQNVYNSMAEAYRQSQNTDSFYHYNQLYHELHDSLESVAARSSLDIAQLRVNNEKNSFTIKELLNQRRVEEQKRNFIIVGIVMAAIIVILLLYSQKQKLMLKQELVLQQKAAAEAEVAYAREQLDMFTQNLLEKSILIKKLEQQVTETAFASEKQEWMQQLTQFSILTEEDLDKFKILFEKLFPGFFMKLKEKVSDITLAELRMAALTRLHLSSRQMASILGISVDSVHKSRQRLRQRLNLDNHQNIESYLAGI
jgi:DNA-binding CsgD family transcriptional regulator/tetratricopeptide (TPR) repeat protein